jgi:Ca2+-binding EF-hand superfamily protein
MGDMAAAEAKINDSLKIRRKRYDVELERQRFNDNLCQKFAKIVDPLAKFIADGKEAITTAKGGLEEQLDIVVKKLATRENDGAVIAQIRELSNQMDARGITHNEHSSLTVKDIEVQWEQYKLFLQNKEKQINEEIKLAKLRGLTPDDLKEIEDNFRSFDKDNDNYLQTSELKTCLYSLGEERSKAQIEEMVVKFGDGKKLIYDQFFELMVQVLGDSDTLDEVINGFKLINRVPDGEQPVATPKKLGLVMEEEFVDYIMKNSKPLGDGVDFVQWSQWIFSR